MDPVSALLTGGGILANIFNTKSTNSANAALNRSNQRFAQQQATIAFNRQRQLIQEQNEYNSYSNQKKLMIDAGYNPYNLTGAIGGSAVSSSSTTPNQGSTPSSIPMQGFDPSLFSMLGNLRLQTAQADNLDADTQKKNQETIKTANEAAFVDVQTEFQKMQNDLFSKYGELEKKIQLDKEDAERGFADAQAIFARVNSRLADYDLSTLKPAELANLTADTLVKESTEILNKINAAKSETEREMLIKQFALQCQLVSAQVLAYRAQASSSYAQAGLFSSQSAWTKNQTSLWSSGGLLYKGAQADTYGRIRDYNLTVKYRNLYDKDFKESLRRNLLGNENDSSYFSRRVNNRIGPFMQFLDEFKTFIPFTIGYNFSNSTSNSTVTKK